MHSRGQLLLPLLLLQGITLVAMASIMLHLYQQYRQEAALIAQQNAIALDVAYRSSVEMYRLDVQTRFNNLIRQEPLLSLLDEAAARPQAELPPLRGRLYRLLRDDYREMVEAGLRQLYFYRPDGQTLLRFHAPALSGDSALAHRALVRHGHALQAPVHGFEIGMLYPGFRYYFPVRVDGHDYGAIELGLPFDLIHANLSRLMPQSDYALLMRRELIEQQGVRIDPGKLVDSPLSEGWLQEHPAYSRITRDFAYSTRVQALTTVLAEHAALQQALVQGEPFTLPLIHDSRGYVVCLHPIHDPDGELAAWIVGYADAPRLVALRDNLLSLGLVALVMTLLLSVAVLVVLVQRQQLADLSSLDGLTGIDNRRTFDENLRHEWRRSRRSGQPLSLLLIDIDHFKQYNDHYGHPAGDACLRQVAAALSDGLTRPADRVARYGGEEFVCLLPETSIDGARQLAESLRRRVEALALPHAASAVSGHVTISLGVASRVARSGSSAAELVSQADACLYQAKSAGRNQVAG